ncbi:hypothetical protein [Loktanella sp. M215]|uniref:hypothetical protein n=1 Tax=Loktanella sp. M215 TaxID=2675431 RepID=UPI001F217E21|nr:hypothetical protein [Loktanella sp. M215]MCF7700533.1 hypothetical protein [Loktanella sp. M215]
MSEEFGPIIMHDGKGCPIPLGTVIRVTVEMWPEDYQTVVEVVRVAGAAWTWSNWLAAFPNGDLCGRVVAYAVKRPDAMAQLRAIAAEPLAITPASVRA